MYRNHATTPSFEKQLEFEANLSAASVTAQNLQDVFDLEMSAAAAELEYESAVARRAREHFRGLQKRYAKQLGVRKHGQVHHAIELQALKRYPGAFSPTELNDVRNMRGIPVELPPGAQSAAKVRDWRRGRRQLHNAKIREIWDRHYTNLDRELRARGLRPNSPAYRTFVRTYLTSARDEIDYVLGQFFTEYRAGLPRAFQ